MDLSRQTLQTNENIYSNFQFIFENQKIFKLIARLEYLSNYNLVYINGFVSTGSTN